MFAPRLLPSPDLVPRSPWLAARPSVLAGRLPVLARASGRTRPLLVALHSVITVRSGLPECARRTWTVRFLNHMQVRRAAGPPGYMRGPREVHGRSTRRKVGATRRTAEGELFLQPPCLPIRDAPRVVYYLAQGFPTHPLAWRLNVRPRRRCPASPAQAGAQARVARPPPGQVLLWRCGPPSIRRSRDVTVGYQPGGASRRARGRPRSPGPPARSGRRRRSWPPTAAPPRVRARQRA
jgi:hypothetical protein